ncbi:LOW QUALITY PROTEIN: signal-induced proliferation-associated protein 1 [Melopsittacus undulatus]|uniref:LOW QUALITY PROTEIN: signal-induced proliferation-associated protein 1 n=1 Tax=Melopsittacus undulatus TaxID=13146 RepID=UPI00146DEFB5|nr:LOW QUALITY PROTEIN: signal-induced proliferation-associated protein 1 [Melopsittacus undulatus]
MRCGVGGGGGLDHRRPLPPPARLRMRKLRPSSRLVLQRVHDTVNGGGHEEGGGGGGSNPTPPRFRDPLLLLGLGPEEPEGGGHPDSFPRPPWSPLLAHYDVQSILFDPAEAPPGPPAPTSGASAAHLEPEDPPDPLGGGGAAPPSPPPPEALVLSCPRFCCETGGEEEVGLGGGLGPPPPGHLPNAAVAVLEEPPAGARPPHPIEHSDSGACYYRKYFYGKEHQNFLGEDPVLGPVAVSLRREEKEGPRPLVLHRIILRTSALRALRGSVLEESLPPSARPPGARGVPPRTLLEMVLPGLGVQGLRLAPPGAPVPETLLKLDEQGLCFQRKVGVLYCRGGQGSEEDMYNNEGEGPAFTQFLALLGTRVRLRGFPHYRAQLDTRTDSTGTHSLYTTYHGYEVMFHVSTMLPFTPSNPQQLLRKRHIGNDIVTIVFQEPGAKPFSPRALRSHFQHIFLVVRAHEPCTPRTSYSVAAVRPQDTPLFGPPLTPGQRFEGGSGLREFLLAKAINGENAAGRGGRLGAMAARTRHQYLRELARVHGTGPPPAAPPRALLPTLGGGRRRRERAPGGGGAGAAPPGALVWGARARRAPDGPDVPCLLGVAAERLVLAAPRGGPGVLFSCACRDVLGWTFAEGRLELFYGAGQWIGLRLPHGAAAEVVGRLQGVTRGCEAQELSLPRGAGGHPGFSVDAAGVVTSVTRFSFAETAGLRPGARVLRVAARPVHALRPRPLRALLRRPTAPITVLPPDRDGRPRRSYSELLALSLERGRGAGGGPGNSSDSEGSDSSGGGEGPPPGGLRPETLRLLQSLLPEEPEPPPSAQPLADPTPDLLLPHHSPSPPGDMAAPPDTAGPMTPPGPPHVPSLRHSLGRLLSGTGEPQEEEWEAIARLATACSSILEALERGGQQLPEPPSTGAQQSLSQGSPEDESRSLSEKVAQLEAMLKRLQEDLQEEQEAQQRLQAEVRTLRLSNRRLQQEQEDAAAQLSRVTRLLQPPGPPPGP